MVIYVAGHLLSAGRDVGVLTRGYPGFLKRADTRHIVSGDAGEELPTSASEEARLIHRRLSSRPDGGSHFRLAIGPKRYENARELEKLGTNWFILDDGYQRLQLARDVDIVLVDATNPFDGGHLLPGGRLREPPGALGRSDMIVITRSSGDAGLEAELRRYSAAPIFHAQTEFEGAFLLSSDSLRLQAAELKAKKCFAFCGIGNPSAFFSDLARWGIPIAGKAVFRDHHVFSREDARTLEKRAAACGAEALVCTEKDALNLMRAPLEKFPVFYCKIKMRPVGEKGFWQEFDRVLARKRPEIAE